MANGRFTLGKQSGGTLGLVFPDGVDNTEVVLPESGELATKEYADTKLSKPELISVTGTATFDGLTQKITMANIGNITLAIGDVIEVSGAVNNNKLFTVESITDNNNIVVNYEHRGTSTPVPSKRLINETGSNCTIKLYNRAKNAPIGQGQDWVFTKANRVNNAINQNLTNRTIIVCDVSNTNKHGVLYSSDGINFKPCTKIGTSAQSAAYIPMSFEVPPFSYFKYDSLDYTQYTDCRELR